MFKVRFSLSLYELYITAEDIMNFLIILVISLSYPDSVFLPFLYIQTLSVHSMCVIV